jgi:hypothetical protein
MTTAVKTGYAPVNGFNQIHGAGGQHPEVVRKLVVVATVFRRDGWYPEIVAAMAQMGAGTAEPMKQSSMYQVDARIAPRAADWPVLIKLLGGRKRRLLSRCF